MSAMPPIATKEATKGQWQSFLERFPQIVAALTFLPVRSSLGRRLFCRFSDQTPGIKVCGD